MKTKILKHKHFIKGRYIETLEIGLKCISLNKKDEKESYPLKVATFNALRKFPEHALAIVLSSLLISLKNNDKSDEPYVLVHDILDEIICLDLGTK